MHWGFLFRSKLGRATFIVIAFLTLHFMLFPEQSTHESPRNVAKPLPRRSPSEFVYKVPEPCHGCPGENGEAVRLSAKEQEDAVQVKKAESFNLIASDKVSLWRSIPDARPSECRSHAWPSDLPSASVVIIFCNERWSPVLRTVYSVLNRTPLHLLHEVILVDDASTIDEMKEPLDRYCAENFGPLVKVYHSPDRLGLIKAKSVGARLAGGDVLVFLDAHCEANVGWYEPLATRIQESRSAILVPSIDNIDDDDLAYHFLGSGSVGGFSWSLHFAWRSISSQEMQRRKNAIDTIRSPTMPGGLLAVNREYFAEIGGYDEGMEIWGGENLELSFRVWMCGGSLEFVPCSRVGHIFRPSHPYNMTGKNSKKDAHGFNSVRLAEVWMDEYKRLYYFHRRDLVDKDVGDLSSRHELRRRLQCKSFQWYLNNVFPEKFIPDENVFAYGMLRNPATNLCLDTLNKDEKSYITIGVFQCNNGASSAQFYSYSKLRELRREERCLTAQGNKVYLRSCGTNGDVWEHQKDNSMKHSVSSKCLDVSGVKNGEEVLVAACDENSIYQKWSFEHYLET